jgi:hypothetical protein
MSNLSALLCFRVLLDALGSRKQTRHDMAANSVVVRASVFPPGEFGRPAGKRPGRHLLDGCAFDSLSDAP